MQRTNAGSHSSFHKVRGQGMTEYIIIVALIGVAAITVYQFLGQTIRQQTTGIAKEMAGQSATSEVDAAQTAASGASTDASQVKGLSNYTNNSGNAAVR